MNISAVSGSMTGFFRGQNIVLLAFALVLCSAAATLAQSTRPQTSPTPFVPEVISRDADLEEMIRQRTAEKQNQERPVANDESATQDDPLPAFSLDNLNEEQQKKLILYLDILTKLEQRAESLRGQLISMMEKQNSVSTKIQQVDYNLRPEVIAGVTSLSGSFRPEDLRDQRKSELEIEKRNLEKLLYQIETSVANLEDNLRRADLMAERVRFAFESVLEATLTVGDTP